MEMEQNQMVVVAEEANSKPFPANEPELDLYSIPTYSSWFSWEEIHETEKTSLKEFFDGSSFSRTPKIYKEYRDFIINKYREDPSRKLTFTEIRKSLVGDVTVVYKVFLFLEKWGLINFSVGSASISDNITTVVVAVDVEKEKERVKVKFEEGAPHGIRVVAVPNSLKVVSLSKNANDAVETLENSFRLPPLASYSDTFGDLLRQKELTCGTCGEECSSGFYESQKQGGIVICAKCFKDQGESKSGDDFKFQDCKVKLNSPGADVWTDAETLLLLESVLKHGDDWDLVAQNVRTKNKFECISKLIELPFGELMFSMTDGKGDERNIPSETGIVKVEPTSVGLKEALKEEDQLCEHRNETKQTGEGGIEEPPSKRRCIAPLADSGGSLMKQVALLSSAMGPRISAAAAEAAIAAICDENPYARVMFEGEDSNVTDVSPSPILKSEFESVPKVEDMETGEKHTELETQEATSERNSIPIKLRIRAAIATALGTAAAHAKCLADQEDREIEHLVATVIETQLRKIHCKIKHFEELELIMEEEYIHIQEQKESIFADWIDVLRRVFKAGIPRWRDRTSVRSFVDNVS